MLDLLLAALAIALAEVPSASPKRPAKGRGWKPAPRVVGLAAEAWQRRALCVLSSVAPMEAPDGSGDILPTWLVSASRAGKSMASDSDMKRVREDFGMAQAEEDNHADGIARGLFLVVDPSRRVDCECKVTERVVERPDGYRYTVPIEQGPERSAGEIGQGGAIA